MDNNVKVRLTVDLTKYLNGLVSGTEGITIGKHGMWSRQNDNFITVRFPMGSLDVNMKSLEVIDDNYLNKLDVRRTKELQDLKTATDIVVIYGSRGGFKYLSYKYIGDGISNSVSNGFKKPSEELIEYFKSIGKKINVKYEL